MKCRWLAAALLLPIGCSVPSSAEAASTASTPTEPASKLSFPDSWVGTWRGTLVMHTRKGPQTVPMSIEIGAAKDPAVRPWVLTYGNQPRNYLLRTVDAKTGRYAIDEQNDIVLPARWIGDTLLSRFSVGGQLLVTRQRFFRDRIEHEIAVGKSEPEKTGKGVSTYAMGSLQRAVLRRVEPGRHDHGHDHDHE